MGAQNDALRQYHTAADFERHSNEQEWDLIERAQGGDIEARNQVVTNNLRFVMQRAQKFVGRGLDLEDMVMEGNFGLFHAINKFDVSKKLRFNTYAAWWIDQYIRRAIMNQANTIRIPVHRQLKTGSEFSFELMGSPLCVDDEDQHTDHLMAVEDSCEDEIKREQAEKILREKLQTLPEKHQRTVILRYGLDSGIPMILTDVAEQVGYSRERVNQICKKFYEELLLAAKELAL